MSELYFANLILLSFGVWSMIRTPGTSWLMFQKYLSMSMQMQDFYIVWERKDGFGDCIYLHYIS